MQMIDLTGKKFGKLTVTGRAPSRGKNKGTPWFCQCECGKIVDHLSANLMMGRTTHCGCSRVIPPPTIKHGHAGSAKNGVKCSPEYSCYTAMKSRCEPNHKKSEYYFKRGIIVCERWAEKNGFENFLADMGPRPSLKHSIDRKDNDLGYHPDNCRWATRKEQQNNTRHVNRITHNGETMCQRDWAKRIGVNNSTITRRLQRGWSLDKVFAVQESGRSSSEGDNPVAGGENKGSESPPETNNPIMQ